MYASHIESQASLKSLTQVSSQVTHLKCQGSSHKQLVSKSRASFN